MHRFPARGTKVTAMRGSRHRASASLVRAVIRTRQRDGTDGLSVLSLAGRTGAMQQSPPIRPPHSRGILDVLGRAAAGAIAGAGSPESRTRRFRDVWTVEYEQELVRCAAAAARSCWSNAACRCRIAIGFRSLLAVRSEGW